MGTESVQPENVPPTLSSRTCRMDSNWIQTSPKRSSWAQPHSCERRAVLSLTSVSVADVDLPVADSMRVLSVTLDRRLTFDNHASAVARSCNYHAGAIRHIRHLLTLDLAQSLACSLILSRIDYCNSVLYGAPSSTIQKLQRIQNNAARIVLLCRKKNCIQSIQCCISRRSKTAKSKCYKL